MAKNRFIKVVLILFMSLFVVEDSTSKVYVNNIFDNNMIIQREKDVKIWGEATPGETIKVEFGGQTQSTKADVNGKWYIFLKPMPANKKPQTMYVTGQENQIVFSNILVGDIWVLGGQSNMEFDLSRIYGGDLEILEANNVNRNIRLFTIPSVASADKEIYNIDKVVQFNSWYKYYEEKGKWSVCYGDKLDKFSAIGYIFGKLINQITDIPIGLIDASWGGTSLEAWIPKDVLSKLPINSDMLDYWNTKLQEYDPDKDLNEKINQWRKNNLNRKNKGLSLLPKPVEPSPSPLYDRNFPGASYNGYIVPIKGLAIKGVVFHHGYNNAIKGNSRPKAYAANFNLLIESWRKAFNDSELPFGILEFSANGEPQTYDNYEIAMLDAAPFIREGQFAAYKNNKNVGYACSYDYQLNWYHPQKKAEIAIRMSRWALSEIYGYNQIVWKPAKVVDVSYDSDKIIVTFDKEVKSSDDRPIEGFSIASKDRHFYPAYAKYKVLSKSNNGKIKYDKTTLEIYNPLLNNPIAVRYAWARNPIANLISDRFIPVPLFRSDNWDFPEAPYPLKKSKQWEEYQNEYKRKLQNAEDLVKIRKVKEAKFILE